MEGRERDANGEGGRKTGIREERAEGKQERYGRRENRLMKGGRKRLRVAGSKK